jgi:hypothetical protein
MKPTWQRWFVWKILENNDLSYDKVALIDVDTMIRWDSPNIFDELSNEDIGACIDNDNVYWVKESIDGYSHMFSTSLDWTEYFNCGMVVLNGNGSKNLCNDIIQYWHDHSHELSVLENTLRKGTDQTPVNYLARQYNLKLLNKKWNLTHMNRKEILTNFKFIDCGYIWHYNGFDKSLRYNLMQQTWNHIKSNYEN